jgi:hypothetical protein
MSGAVGRRWSRERRLETAFVDVKHEQLWTRMRRIERMQGQLQQQSAKTHNWARRRYSIRSLAHVSCLLELRQERLDAADPKKRAAVPVGAGLAGAVTVSFVVAAAIALLVAVGLLCSLQLPLASARSAASASKAVRA